MSRFVEPDFHLKWKEGRGRPLRMMITGQVMLLSAIVIMGIGNVLGA